jgi:hypothetical protein
MEYSYNTLPPFVKKAVDVMAGMYNNYYTQWHHYYMRDETYVTIALNVVRASLNMYHSDNARYLNTKIGHKYWLRTIEAFELLTDDIREELDPNFSKLPPPKVYPNTCKICHSPARRCINITMCSNVKCRSRKMINKLYNSSPKKENQ